MRTHRIALSLALGILAGVAGSGVSAQEGPGSDYLVGRWSVEGKAGCDSKGVEHVEFRADDTFGLDQAGRVDAVGFWEIAGNRVDLHMVASPHRLAEVLQDYQGKYDYAHLAVFVFDAKPDSFEAIVPFGEEVRRRSVHRCQ